MEIEIQCKEHNKNKEWACRDCEGNLLLCEDCMETHIKSGHEDYYYMDPDEVIQKNKEK